MFEHCCRIIGGPRTGGTHVPTQPHACCLRLAACRLPARLRSSQRRLTTLLEELEGAAAVLQDSQANATRLLHEGEALRQELDDVQRQAEEDAAAAHAAQGAAAQVRGGLDRGGSALLEAGGARPPDSSCRHEHTAPCIAGGLMLERARLPT